MSEKQKKSIKDIIGNVGRKFGVLIGRTGTAQEKNEIRLKAIKYSGIATLIESGLSYLSANINNGLLFSRLDTLLVSMALLSMPALGLGMALLDDKDVEQSKALGKDLNISGKKSNDSANRASFLKMGAAITPFVAAVGLLAGYGIELGAPELWNARTEPIDRDFEKITEGDHDVIIRQSISEQLSTKISDADNQILQYLLNQKDGSYNWFIKFVKFFGETYFANDESLIERYGADYEGYLKGNFLPKIFSSCAIDGINPATLFALSEVAVGVTGLDYGLDIKDERKRVVFQMLRTEEGRVLGSTNISDQIVFSAYSLADIYGGTMGPRTGIRLSEASPSTGIYDQEVEINAFAIGMVSRMMPDKYLRQIMLQEDIGNCMQLIEKQRDQLGLSIFNFCNKLTPDNPILRALRDSATEGGMERNQIFWNSIGLGMGINDISKLIHEDDIVKNLTHPTQAWHELITAMNDKDIISLVQDRKIDLTNFIFSKVRSTFVSEILDPSHNPAENVYWLIKDQMFRHEFREYVKKNCGESLEEWNSILELWKNHEALINNKQRLVKSAYLDTGPLEYDSEYQCWLSRGLMLYYKNEIQKFPRLERWVKDDPFAEMVLILNIREIAPSWVWVNMRSGPIASNSITPLNENGVLSQWDKASEIFEQEFPGVVSSFMLPMLMDVYSPDQQFRIVNNIDGNLKMSRDHFEKVRSQLKSIIWPMEIDGMSAYNLSKRLYLNTIK